MQRIQRRFEGNPMHAVVSKATVLLLVTASLVLAQEPSLVPASPDPQTDWRFAQPGATAIGGVNLQRLLNSPLVQQLMQEGASQDPSAAMMTGIFQAALSQVESIQFSVMENGTDTPDTLVQVSGTLDEALLAMMAQSNPESAQTPEAAQMEWRRVDADTLILGMGPGLDEAVSRLSAPEAATLTAASLSGGADLSTDHDFWIAGAVPDAPTAAEVGEQIDGFALGFSLQDDLLAELAAVIPDPATAQFLLGMLKAGLAEQDNAFARRLQMSLDGTTARLRLNVPGEEILTAIREGQLEQQLSGAFGSDAEGNAASGMLSLDDLEANPFKDAETAPAEPVQPEPAPRRPGGVIIYGLEDGPREIPLNDADR